MSQSLDRLQDFQGQPLDVADAFEVLLVRGFGGGDGLLGGGNLGAAAACLAGYLKEVLVDIGDPVEKDEILLGLWIPEMQDELAQKQALLEQAHAEVGQANAAVRAEDAAAKTAQSQVAKVEAGIKRTKGEYEQAKAEHARISDLARRGSTGNRSR